MNLRLKADASRASAEEKASIFERNLSHLSENIEKEKNRFNNEIELLKRDSKLSVSRISADVSRYICQSSFPVICNLLLFNLPNFSVESLKEWNAELSMLRKNRAF